jgi:hypothetical protein
MRHSTKTARNLRDYLLRSDSSRGKADRGNTQTTGLGRLDPFGRPSGTGRFLRIPNYGTTAASLVKSGPIHHS